MKKLTIWLLALLLCCTVIVACGKEGDQKDQTTNDSPANSPADQSNGEDFPAFTDADNMIGWDTSRN